MEGVSIGVVHKYAKMEDNNNEKENETYFENLRELLWIMRIMGRMEGMIEVLAHQDELENVENENEKIIVEIEKHLKQWKEVACKLVEKL